ncbi:hypothetical protein ACROYT_G011553 [Oculina patagonica]
MCKDRREFGLLQSTLGNLQRTSETRIKEYDDNKRDLEWVLYNLRQEKAGLTPLGSIIAGDTRHLTSSRGMQAESDCRQIKSIRRPLAPEATRDHGNRPALQPNLQNKEGSVIPRAVEREILRRQTMRLKSKKQERQEGVKQREMQLEDMVGVYTRINMGKGCLNYKGKPRLSTDETRTKGAHATSSSWKYQYNLPSIEVQQTTESLLSKESADWNMRNGTHKVLLPNGSKLELVPPVQAKSKEVSGTIPKITRKNVQQRLALPRGYSVVLEDKQNDYRCARQDSFTINSERGKLEHSEDNTVLPFEELNENGKDTFENIPGELEAVEQTSGKVNDMKSRDNSQEFATFSSEKTSHSSGEARGGNETKKLVRAIKNRVILPFRLQRQTRRGNRTDLQASNRSDRYIKDIESVMNENIKEKALFVPNEEHDAVLEEKPNPLSAGKLQQLIREKVLSQSQKSNKRANQKTVLLADYVRTLQKHMGIKDDVPESYSPDFSETPFIAAEKRFGSEDEQEKEPRAVDRRLEMMQHQIVRLPASFNLLDGDLVDN